MHLEFLVEGQSDLTTLSILMKSILGSYQEPHTWKIHKHRGIGNIPEDPASFPDRINQTLLHNLPAKLRAYGKEKREDLLIVVLVDLDDRPDSLAFEEQLISLLEYCDERPNVLFRIAIEEVEAWFLGDHEAIRRAYPDALLDKLGDYVQDAQCGTWEKLADVVYSGGINALVKHGKRSPFILEQKRKWAVAITPHMELERNMSPSFRSFWEGIGAVVA